MVMNLKEFLIHWIKMKCFIQLDLLAIFHSHPEGPFRPSETDVKEFLYPGVATIICSPINENWMLKSFMIENDHYHEIELVLV